MSSAGGGVPRRGTEVDGISLILSTIIVAERNMNPSRLTKLTEMERQKPGDAFLNFAIALEYVGVLDSHEAIKRFEQLMEQHPEYLASYYQAGKLYEELNELAKAIDVYKKGIEIAHGAGDQKTMNELREALMLLYDE